MQHPSRLPFTRAAALASAAILSVPASADVLEVDASNSLMATDAAFDVNQDGGVDGLGDFTDAIFPEPDAGNTGNLRMGRFQGRVQQPLFAFQLPTLDPGEFLVAADLDFSTSFDTGNPQFNGDLEAIGVRSSGTITASDFQAPGTLIQDNALFNGVPDFNRRSIDATGEAALLDYLENNYAAGDFLILRFTLDTGAPLSNSNPPDNDYYRVFAHNTGATPTLELTTEIPEPASLTLLAAGIALLGGRRRR